MLKARLDHVTAIVDRLMTSLDRNPELVKGLTRAISDIGQGAGQAVDKTGDAAKDIGKGAEGRSRTSARARARPSGTSARARGRPSATSAKEPAKRLVTSVRAPGRPSVISDRAQGSRRAGRPGSRTAVATSTNWSAAWARRLGSRAGSRPGGRWRRAGAPVSWWRPGSIRAEPRTAGRHRTRGGQPDGPGRRGAGEGAGEDRRPRD